MLKGAGLSPKAVDMEDFHAEGMEQLANEPFVIYLVVPPAPSRFANPL